MIGLAPREMAAEGDSSGESHVVNYDMDDYVRVETREQLRALGHQTREEILVLLSERAASVSQLADAMGKPKGSVGYHVKVLEKAGLVRIVDTRQVRAITEKFYGRVGRTVILGKDRNDDPLFMLEDVRREIDVTEGEALPMFTMRRVRISEEQAVAFAERVLEVAEEFLALPRSGSRTFGMVAGVYPTNLPAFREDEEDE